ncbi:MAG TPA: hypothetical protein VFI46_08670 [Jiangellaceae bacterium]|nr:hypothetical protein [Jiangellaceae bacterium]
MVSTSLRRDPVPALFVVDGDTGPQTVPSGCETDDAAPRTVSNEAKIWRGVEDVRRRHRLTVASAVDGMSGGAVRVRELPGWSAA